MVTMEAGSSKEADDSWDLVIEPKSRKTLVNFGELASYGDLILLFVKRDFVNYYKQTVLGPLWFLLQPMLRVLIYYIIFARIAEIDTDGIPPILFYLAGLTFWEYFATCWKKTSETFIENQHIFGKVYFPRIVVPIAVLLSNAIKLGVQLILLLAVMAYYVLAGAKVEPQATLLLLPLFILVIAMLGLGAGLIITSLTTKYRDLKFLLDTAVQLLMYLSPIIYPLSLAEGAFRKILLANPMTAILEALKYSLLGTGEFLWMGLVYSAAVALLTLLLGLYIFNRTERTFIDTV